VKPNNFDFLRFALASLVILSHSWDVTGGDAAFEHEWLHRLSGGQTDFGAIAVDAFFAISGLLVAQSWDRSRGFVDFMTKRVRRIYPAFLVMSLVTAALVMPAFADSRPPFQAKEVGVTVLEALDLVAYGYLHGFFSHVQAVQAFVHDPMPLQANGAIWTVRYEFVCYVVLGVASLTAIGRSRWAALVAFLAFFAYNATGRVPPTQSLVTALFCASYAWPRFGAFFLAGVAWQKLGVRPRGWTAALGLLAIAIAMRAGGGLNAILPIALPPIVFWLADLRGPLNGFGARGDFSYGTYIYGFLVQQMIIACLPGLSVAALFALSLPAAVGCGALSWYLVERRFLPSRLHAGVVAPNVDHAPPPKSANRDSRTDRPRGESETGREGGEEFDSQR
jgi:peptidoglycan/LPS O-acetylase OafA/YrhL